MQTKPRHNLSLMILLLYFLPVFLYAAYGIGTVATYENWIIVTLGVAVSTFGTALLYSMISSWQSSVQDQLQDLNQPKVNVPFPIMPPQSISISEPPPMYQLKDEPAPAPKVDANKHHALLEEVNSKDAELQKLYQEHNHLSHQGENLMREIDVLRKNLQESSYSKEKLQNDCLKTIGEQRDIIEQQEQHILKLESQVRDLNYEIKTLLQVNDDHTVTKPVSTTKESLHDLQTTMSSDKISAAIPAPLYRPEQSNNLLHTPIAPFQTKQVSSPPSIEANLQLKRCIDIAQKITVTSLIGGETSRFKDLSVNNYSIDLRRLCDSLRSENSNPILLFSQKEDKLLFVNNQAKNLLGWSPEKIVQDFPHIVQQGMLDWKQALSQLATKNETQLQLKLKTKSGQEVPVQCLLGIIPTGLFRNHVIGVLMQDS